MNTQSKTVTAYAEAYNNIEWSDGPAILEVEFRESELKHYQQILDFDKANPDSNPPHVRTWWWSNYYRLHEDVTDDVDGSYEGYYKIEDYPGYYAEFVPEYRLSGSETRLDKYGHITVVFFLKHTPEEIWGEFNLQTLLEKLEGNQQ